MWLRSETHPSNRASRERLDIEISTSDPSGNGGLCTSEKGLLSLVGWTVTVIRGEEPMWGGYSNTRGGAYVGGYSNTRKEPMWGVQ